MVALSLLPALAVASTIVAQVANAMPSDDQVAKLFTRQTAEVGSAGTCSSSLQSSSSRSLTGASTDTSSPNSPNSRRDRRVEVSLPSRRHDPQAQAGMD